MFYENVVYFKVHKCNTLPYFLSSFRRKERSKDKKSRKKMPTVYEDIDEYEMIVSNTYLILICICTALVMTNLLIVI